MTLSVIGCGNPNRRDDGVGPAVIALLRNRQLPEDVKLFDAGTDGMSVLYNARGSTRLVIVDARIPESAPGAVFEVPGRCLEAAPPASFNLHDFRWDHALFAGRKIYGEAFPDAVTVFLVEAGSIDLGLGLSAAVEAAAVTVADRICAMATSRSSDGADPVSAQAMPGPAADASGVRIARGAVYLSAAVYERYFSGIGAVILLIRDGELQVLPVHQVAAGGCLLKVRTAAGDRVASAPDVFLAAGLHDLEAANLPARWSSDCGALVVELPAKSAN